jgi:16S rRNA processing protein RimM
VYYIFEVIIVNFQIGVITKAQGIRGEFRVLPTTDEPSRFELLVGGEIFIGNRAVKLQSARMQKNIVVLKIEGADDRNAAERLVGAVISIPEEKALPLSPDEFFIRDLIGLRAETESGEPLGEITRVLHTGANDVYVIGEEFMIPAIKDVVIKIDLAAGRIILRLQEGLRELTL